VLIPANCHTTQEFLEMDLTLVCNSKSRASGTLRGHPRRVVRVYEWYEYTDGRGSSWMHATRYNLCSARERRFFRIPSDRSVLRSISECQAPGPTDKTRVVSQSDPRMERFKNCNIHRNAIQTRKSYRVSVPYCLRFQRVS